MLGDAIAATLPRLRAEAESTLRDRCTVERKSGSTIDPQTGARIDQWSVLHAYLPCRVRVDRSEQQVTTGEQEVTVLRAICAVPFSALGIDVGHRVTLTTSGDPDLIGLPLFVKAVPRGRDMLLRRLSVADDQG